MVVLLVIGTIIFFVVIDLLTQRMEKRKAKELAMETVPRTVVSQEVGKCVPVVPQVVSMDEIVLPKGYFFDTNHSWLRVLPSGIIKIGIDDFVQKIVGKMKVIPFKKSGDDVRKGEPIFYLRQGSKMLSFLSPISGKIDTINLDIKTNPEIIKTDPYRRGWVMTIIPSQLSTEIKDLLIAEDVIEWFKRELSAFRKFITERMTSTSSEQILEPMGITLMDGGQIIYGILEYSDEKTWKEFERLFLKKNNGGE